ncbi:MAG TPA: DUF6702 family protein [Flavisolibacter sp.]|nr:DUF6702 family protein [Flavisolibacter sp.]
MALLISKLFLLLLPSIADSENITVKDSRHPFYVSVVELEQNSNERTLELSFKFFSDDFEHTLEKAYNRSIDITAAKEKTSVDKLITDYISKNFSVTSDNKKAQLQYLGFEMDKESVYCYFEVPNISSVKKLDIHNSLLHDFSKEQLNIMHVTVNGKRQSTRLAFPSTYANFIF